MKKILYPLIALAALLTTSCDMNLDPDGTMRQEEAMTSFENLSYYRNGLYSSLRGITGGSSCSTPAIQSDEFIGVIINGNRLGSVNNGDITSSTGEVTGTYGSMYGFIASINYFFPYIEAMLGTDLNTDEQIAQLNRYTAECKFMRAYCYWRLLDCYCGNYTASNGDTPALGVPIVTVYNPTPIASEYPGRTTLNETYAQIEKDLDEAYEGLSKFEEEQPEIAAEEMTVRNPAYLNSYVVRALQARVALLKGDWQKAYDYANEVYSSRKYPLTSRAQLSTLWNSDSGSELIFRPFADADEMNAVPATGLAWLSSSDDRLDYIPTANLYHLYQTGDERKNIYFKNREINCFSVQVLVPSFTKYNGNPIFNATQSSNSYKNLPKPFRTSEQVLIMAEAAYNLGEEGKANDALNALRAVRILKYQSEKYSGNELLQMIRDERQRELVGEGFRISDLRRWGLPFTRQINYELFPDAASVTVVAGRNVEYIENDYRYVWPIPSSEFQTNPQMAGQQNPGY